MNISFNIICVVLLCEKCKLVNKEKVSTMKFSTVKTSAAKQVVVTNDMLLESMENLHLSIQEVGKASLELDKTCEVLSNCHMAIAGLESFGLCKEVVGILNYDGNFFSDIGMEAFGDDPNKMITAAPEESSTKKVIGAVKGAASAAGKAVVEGFKKLWKAIVEFARRWFTANGWLAASLEKNLVALRDKNLGSEAFDAEVNGTIFKADEFEEFVNGLSAYDGLLNKLKTDLPAYVGKLKGDSSDVKPGEAFKDLASFADKLKPFGVTVGEDGVWTINNDGMAKPADQKYKAAGWDQAFMLKNGQTLLTLMKTDRNTMSALVKAIDAAYKAAVAKDEKIVATAKTAVAIANKLMTHKAKIVSSLATQLNVGIKRVLKPAKKAEGEKK